MYGERPSVDRIPMLRLSLVIALLAGSAGVPALAQDTPPEDVLVTADQLAALKKEVDASLQADDCGRALQVLPDFVKKANTHANMIYAGAKAAFESPRQTSIPSALANQMRFPLQARETAMRDRNLGWVSIGDCMVKMGRPDAAVGAYVQALELISFEEERETWDRARIGLWRLMGVTAQ